MIRSAQRLAAVTALSRYAGLLMQFSAAVPTDSQASLLQAIEVSNQSFQTEMIGTVVSIGSPTWEVLPLSDGTSVQVGVNENTELQSGIVVGDLVKVDIQDSSSMLWAVEIELADDGEDDQNDNEDVDNANTNDNANENENANDNEVGENDNEDDDDLDENDNDDVEDDDDADENDNEDTDENENANENDNGNDNANDNGNDNEDDD
jgi:hypothetical protein